MAVAFKWTADEPTVDSWSEAIPTDTFTNNPNQYTNWTVYIDFSIGRISGTRNLAVRAVVYGKANGGLSNQNANATPQIRLTGESDWVEGSNLSKTISKATYQILATAYCKIEGAEPRASFDVKFKKLAANKYKQLASPISAPKVYINVSGTNVEADGVFVNVGGTWIEADAMFVNVSGTWKEA